MDKDLEAIFGGAENMKRRGRKPGAVSALTIARQEAATKALAVKGTTKGSLVYVKVKASDFPAGENGEAVSIGTVRQYVKDAAQSSKTWKDAKITVAADETFLVVSKAK